MFGHAQANDTLPCIPWLLLCNR